MNSNLRATLVAGIIVAIIGSILSGPYIVPFVTSLIFPNSSPNFKSLTADLESPQPAGSTIEWTAKALDLQKDIMLYNFILKNANTGSILKKRGWNSNNEWTWVTTESDSGDYIVEAWVKDGHHATKVDESDDQCSVNYKISSNLPPYFTSLSADLKSPQPAGSTIEWTAKAKDPENNDLNYKFILKNANTGSILSTRGWKSSNEWRWVTTESDSGDYIVEAWVKDGHHATESDRSDDQYSFTYKITPNLPPYFTSLSADLKSPQPAGSTIEWTAKAKDPENNDLNYKFILKDANTGSILSTRGWKSSNEWRWVTTESDSGDYIVEAWVKDGHHATESDKSDDQFSNTYALIDGRRIKVNNLCPSEINIILRYKSPLVGWTIDGPWLIKSNASTYLSGGKNSNYEAIRSTSRFNYYYAYSSDKNNFKWNGNNTWEYNGESIGMGYWEANADYNNDYVLALACS